MIRRMFLLFIAVALLAVGCSSSGDEGTDPSDSAKVEDPEETPVSSLSAAGGPLELLELHAEPDPLNGGRIVDEAGSEVLLRGVNVNAYAEYWAGNEFDTVFPFTESDAVRISELGWNSVRLLFTWSLVEPSPGEYDDAYLDELAGVVDLLASHGIYTILDSHQDAWGATLAARADEQCPEGAQPAVGWDGAPEWATLVDDEQARCATAGIRETSPAVLTAWAAFWANDEGPGGIGIRTRYASMWGHIAQRFAGNPAVAGYDLMNEPNAFGAEAQEALVAMYSESLTEIRAAEEAADGAPTLVLFEPTALWSSSGAGAPPMWDFDEHVVYSPHIYAGAFDGGPIQRSNFEVAVEEAALFGGAPILTGEWGTAFEAAGGTQRTGPDGDGYFALHQGFQDEFHVSASLWEWHESCGDPHKAKDEQTLEGDEVPVVAGIFEVDCATNEVLGERIELIDALLWAYPRRAPGLTTTVHNSETGSIDLRGSASAAGQKLVVFYPSQKFGVPETSSDGLSDVEVVEGPGGSSLIVALSTGGEWTLGATAP